MRLERDLLNLSIRALAEVFTFKASSPSHIDPRCLIAELFRKPSNKALNDQCCQNGPSNVVISEFETRTHRLDGAMPNAGVVDAWS